MGSENEIERFYMYAGDGYTVEHEEHDEGEWVRWPDHVAARKADQERIAEGLVSKRAVRAALRAYDRTQSQGLPATEQMEAMLMAAFRAALSEPSENQVEKVARVIDDWEQARDILQDIEDEVLEHANLRPFSVDAYISRMLALPKIESGHGKESRPTPRTHGEDQ